MYRPTSASRRALLRLLRTSSFFASAVPPKKNDDDSSKNDASSSVFDFTKEWKERVEKEILPSSSMLQKLFGGGSSDDETGKKDLLSGPSSSETKASSVMNDSVFQSISGGIMTLMKGGSSQAKTQQTVSDIVAQVRDTTDQGELNDGSASIQEIFETLRQYSQLVEEVADKYVSGIDFSKLTPTSLLYYLEYEDERKNPSWKNRIHRFCPGIDINKMEELHHNLELALLAYADTADEIRDGLQNHPVVSGELVYADLKSEPGAPAHFLAVRTDVPDRPGLLGMQPPLEVLMGVRGTKSLADAITDVLCDSQEYRDGKAHEYIVKGGMYLFEKHRDLLESLAEKAGKSRITLHLVGHSLGAGAASIAGMEFQKLSNFDVQVVGFGCPAMLSKDLAEDATFITTIVNDSDVIPRTSAATITNLLLSLVEFDWRAYAKRDLQHALSQLQRANSTFFTSDLVEKVRNTVEPLMDQHLESFIEKNTTDRVPCELFPPGRVIHLYHDGVGVSGCYVPNDFFTEMDVTRRMVDDHMIHAGYQQVFLEIMRQHKGDHHFSFDSAKVDG